MVQVEQQQGHALAVGARMQQQRLRAFAQLGAVGQAGQRVVQRQVTDVLVDAAALGQVVADGW